jgi:hypothetical protein
MRRTSVSRTRHEQHLRLLTLLLTLTTNERLGVDVSERKTAARSVVTKKAVSRLVSFIWRSERARKRRKRTGA